MTHPMDPIKRLGQGLAALAESLGADMRQFLLDPDLEGDEHVVRAIFVLGQGDDVEIDIDAFLEDIENHVRDNTKDN